LSVPAAAAADVTQDGQAVTSTGRSSTKKAFGPSSPYASYKDGDDALNLAGLLNILDGVVDTPGRLIIMTSNHPEKLDPALIRPGRINRKIFMGNLALAEALAMAKHYFADQVTEAAELRLRQVWVDELLSPATLESMCAEFECIEELLVALEDLPELQKQQQANQELQLQVKDLQMQPVLANKATVGADGNAAALDADGDAAAIDADGDAAAIDADAHAAAVDADADAASVDADAAPVDGGRSAKTNDIERKVEPQVAELQCQKAAMQLARGREAAKQGQDHEQGSSSAGLATGGALCNVFGSNEHAAAAAPDIAVQIGHLDERSASQEVEFHCQQEQQYLELVKAHGQLFKAPAAASGPSVAVAAGALGHASQNCIDQVRKAYQATGIALAKGEWPVQPRGLGIEGVAITDGVAAARQQLLFSGRAASAPVALLCCHASA
jgi:hypothetical protein